MSYVDLAAVEMSGDDKPVFVAADVENNQVTQSIGGRKRCSQALKAVVVAVSHNSIPAQQRCLTIRVSTPEFLKCLPRNDMHDRDDISFRDTCKRHFSVGSSDAQMQKREHCSRLSHAVMNRFSPSSPAAPAQRGARACRDDRAPTGRPDRPGWRSAARWAARRWQAR